MQNIFLPHVVTVRVTDLLPKLRLSLPAIGFSDSSGPWPGKSGLWTTGPAVYPLACSFGRY